ncbi:MAG: DUF2163 domain-containing protein [bacterium]
MRLLSTEFSAHLAQDSTYLATCWRITRQDGLIFGFTDHDNNISFEGADFLASSSGTVSMLSSTADMSVDNTAIEAALNHVSLTEEDLDSGRYDGAEIEIWRVNWQAPSQRLLLKSGTLGQVERTQNSYRVEFRGVFHHLDYTTGRIYQYGCDAALGDERCSLDLSTTNYKTSGVVSAISAGAYFLTESLSAYAPGWFTHGKVTFLAGAAAGLTFHIKSHSGQSPASIELWQSIKSGLQIDDPFQIIVGCDKQFSTCREKFSNGLNFRGFPHMPGNDFITLYPLRGEAHKGGKR